MSVVEKLGEIRLTDPGAVARALERRVPAPAPDPARRMLIVAADHPARGSLRAGDNEMAMASREELLARCVAALSHGSVTGFLGTPDVVEDLALLGALDGKLVLGSMNRTGLQDSCFELDDRISAYDADAIAHDGLDGGKLLVRIDPGDAVTPSALERAARTVGMLARREKIALLEPFLVTSEAGRVSNDLSPPAVIRAVAIASALGPTSARTWLKLPCVPRMDEVMAATSLPTLLLGGEVPEYMDTALQGWRDALLLPNVRGLVIGRSLLFPRGGDVAAALDRIVEVL